MLTSHTNEGLGHDPQPHIRVHLEERKVRTSKYALLQTLFWNIKGILEML